MKLEQTTEYRYIFCLSTNISLTEIIKYLVKKTISIITNKFTMTKQGNLVGSEVNNLDENTITGKLVIGVSISNKYTIREKSVPRP